jgi:hypothetical protein
MRDKYKDTLVGLMAASLRLDGATSEYDRAAGDRLGEVLSLEADGDLAEFRALAVKGITNKKAMKYIKDKTDKDPLFLEPHGSSYWLPRVEGVRIYALGPPRDEKLLLSLDPEEDEGFEFGHLALRRQDAAFLGAASSAFQDDVVDAGQPFAPRYRIPIQKVTDSPHKQFFADHYEKEAHDWRRIDHDWLHAAEHLALRLADEVNNTSLVMAIEMPKSKQVLLFTGDAQRGSWVSWDKGDWTDGDGNQVTAQELLRRTVFYKVGHHGSHNATLKGGSTDDPHPGLEWMAQDEYRDHFVAMIPANRPWAYGKSKPWKHPLPSIEAALIQKAKGRVWRIDQDHVERWDGSSDADWEAFNKRNIETEMYFEYTIPDELL